MFDNPFGSVFESVAKPQFGYVRLINNPGEVLGYYLGTIGDIGGTSYLFSRTGGYHTGQVKGSSVLGDGTGYGTLSSAVTVPSTNWTEPITGKIIPGGSGQDIILSGSVLGNDEFVLDVDANGFLRAYAYISTTISTITTYPVSLRDGQEHSFAVDYQSGNILLYVDGSLRDSNPVALNGSQTIVNVFRRAGGSSIYAGNLCDLKSALFDLPMLCVGSTVEYSATAGLPDCTWSNFAGAIYQEHTDGSGTDRANEDGYSKNIDTPVGFTWPATLPQPDIYIVDEAPNVETYDISEGRPTGVAYYVSTTGNDANSGADWDNALASIYTALNKADVVVVYVEAGIYQRTKSWQGVSPARPVSVIGVGGYAVSTAYDVLSWSADSTYPNVSKASRSTAYMVRDTSIVDSDGISQELTLVGSVMEVSTTPGSYYTDNVSVWVLPIDERIADANINVYIAVQNGEATTYSIYCENVIFDGSTSGAFYGLNATSSHSVLRFKNCIFKHSRDNNPGGLRIEGNCNVVLQDCVAEHNSLDGFNYHSSGAYIPTALEINCIGRNNGKTEVENNNGSSMHDAGTVIRIGGEYYNNFGPNVIDVGGSLTWCIGTRAYDSIAPNTNSDFYTSGTMWLDQCSGGDYLVADGYTMYVHDCIVGTQSGTGDFLTYDRSYGTKRIGATFGAVEFKGPIAPDMEIVSGTAYPSLVGKGALGPKTQGLSEWTGEAQNDISLLPFNTNDTTFVGSDAMVVYETAQDADTIALIQSRIGG